MVVKPYERKAVTFGDKWPAFSQRYLGWCSAQGIG